MSKLYKISYNELFDLLETEWLYTRDILEETMLGRNEYVEEEITAFEEITE